MSKESDDFEKQIARIHDLLEGLDASVTWNDKISDPDNLTQFRQIDFTVRKNDIFTIGECRFRKQPEDVKWIEELIGRRLSLNADKVIAVSSSGFTKGAVKKAYAHGVMIRNFFEISEKELSTWGEKTKITITFATLNNLTFKIPLDNFNNGNFDLTDKNGKKINLLPTLQKIAFEIDNLRPSVMPASFTAPCKMDGLYIGGQKTDYMIVTGTFEKYDKILNLASIYCYAESKESNKKSAAYIQKFSFADSEIIGHDNCVSLIIDFSQIEYPPNTLLLNFGTDFGKIMTMNSLETLGLEQVFKNKFQIKVEVYKNSQKLS